MWYGIKWENKNKTEADEEQKRTIWSEMDSERKTKRKNTQCKGKFSEVVAKLRKTRRHPSKEEDEEEEKKAKVREWGRKATRDRRGKRRRPGHQRKRREETKESTRRKRKTWRGDQNRRENKEEKQGKVQNQRRSQSKEEEEKKQVAGTRRKPGRVKEPVTPSERHFAKSDPGLLFPKGAKQDYRYSFRTSWGRKASLKGV